MLDKQGRHLKLFMRCKLHLAGITATGVSFRSTAPDSRIDVIGSIRCILPSPEYSWTIGDRRKFQAVPEHSMSLICLSTPVPQMSCEHKLQA